MRYSIFVLQAHPSKIRMNAMLNFLESWIVTQKVEFWRGSDFENNIAIVTIRSQKFEYLFRISQNSVFERGCNRMSVHRHQFGRPGKCGLQPCSPVNFLKFRLVAKPLILMCRQAFLPFGFERLGNALR